MCSGPVGRFTGTGTVEGGYRQSTRAVGQDTVGWGYPKMSRRVLLLLLIFILSITAYSCFGSGADTPPVESETDPGDEAQEDTEEDRREEEVTDEAEEDVDDAGEEAPSPSVTFPRAADVEDRFAVEEVFGGITFDRPLDFQIADDGSGRIFVVEQGGRIYSLQGSDPFERELFLDIEDRVDDSGFEMGLLSLAFHPQFADNGYFFVNYTRTGGTVVARFRASPEGADPDSEQVMLAFPQPFRNHNGGQLAFGPDDYLYIATGDGGGGGDPQGNGQNPSTFHGNILRIDVDTGGSRGEYAIPPGNPFVGNDEGWLEEIYAYGLRNPWRFSFDPVTGYLWVADVGQDRVEEINIVEKGGNYGWNIMEGSLCFEPRDDCDTYGLELPVYEYHHPLGRSITGGHVYRGERLPALEGAYIYGDYVTGRIWGLWYEEGRDPENFQLAETDLNITSFGVDKVGELFLTAFDGKVYRLNRR